MRMINKKLKAVEENILKLLCNGNSIKNVGDKLVPPVARITLRTYFIKSIKKKLDAKTIMQACAIYASKHPEIILERK